MITNLYFISYAESSPVITHHQPEKITPTENLSPKPRIDYDRLKKNVSSNFLYEDFLNIIYSSIIFLSIFILFILYKKESLFMKQSHDQFILCFISL